MSSLKRDIRATDTDLVALVAAFEKASYRHDYYRTFTDFLDYAVAEYTYPPADYVRPGNYDEREWAAFPDMLAAAVRYVRARANLWTGGREATGWADPFGTLFEAISGNFKKAAQGLFFTPESLCTMIAQMTIGMDGVTAGQTMLEPACGSGRLALAAGALNPGLFICANDIDPACTKMAAVNMALNGLVGQCTCMNGLWPVEDNYRFGYTVAPLVWVIEQMPPEMAVVAGVVAGIETAMQYKKMYVLLPLAFADALAGAKENAGASQIAENAAEARAAEGVPDVEALFREVIPQGVQGRLFE